MKKPQSGIYEDKHIQLHVENGVEVTLFIIYLCILFILRTIVQLWKIFKDPWFSFSERVQ